MENKIFLTNVDVITPKELIHKQMIVINELGKIAYIGPNTLTHIDGTVIDLQNMTVIPGMIDIHVHGGNGIVFNEGDFEKNILFYSSWAPSSGVTHYLCSIATPTPKDLLKLVSRATVVFSKDIPGAKPLGLHLEGPFLNEEKNGAINSNWLRAPNISLVHKIIEAGKGWIKQVTLAPELPGAEEVCKEFDKNGIVVSIGHTNADYNTARKAISGNYKNITHTFNAQSGFGHREPGVVGAVLSSDVIKAELIADFIHVHPAAIEILIRCLGYNRVVLITDGNAAAGLNDGKYEFLTRTIIVKNQKATLENGTIAGSTLLMNQCVKNLHQKLNYPLTRVVQMASLNPAQLLRLDHEIGAIEVGRNANLVVLDKDINIVMTFINGKRVFVNQSN